MKSGTDIVIEDDGESISGSDVQAKNDDTSESDSAKVWLRRLDQLAVLTSELLKDEDFIIT